MVETKPEVKRLSNKEDLANLVVGDVVTFGIFKEECLCYNYPGLKEGELFFLSRFKYTGVEGCIGVIFEHLNNLEIEKGYFDINRFSHIKNPLSDGEVKDLINKGLSYEDIGDIIYKDLPRTQDKLFHYGVNLVIRKIKDIHEKRRKFLIENTEKYEEFNKALEEVKL